MNQIPSPLLDTEIAIVSPRNGAAKQKLSELLHATEYTLLYFYPKDLTPGCTLEGKDFSRLSDDFAKLGVQIVGVSLDDEASHEEFIRTECLGIPLITDSGILHDHFAVIGEKKLYGRTYKGVLRSTFLIQKDGTVLEEWRNVRATGHADRLFGLIGKRLGKN